MHRILYFLLTMASLHAAPLAPSRVHELREQLRTNFFISTPLPALEATTHRRFSPARGVAAEAVTYATQHGTRVPAILYLPDPLPAGGKIPGVVIVTGHGGDKYSWYSYFAGIAFARGGAAVLTYDQAGEGERSSFRQSNTREHDKLEGDATMARRLCGLMITDVMQGVSYLASRSEIDPARLGAAGYSMGSFVLAIAGALEPRLHACVLAAGGNLDGPSDYWGSSSKLMCQGYPAQSLAFLGDSAAVLYALHAARGPTLVRNGTADQVITAQRNFAPFFADLQARTAKLHGSNEGVFEFGFKEGTGHRPYFLERPAVAWLARHLAFPKWTESVVPTLPETHVGSWARQHRVAVDGSLGAEEREAGTRAVGADVPGYEREDLSVFTPAQWSAHRDELTFEAWTAAANAASRSK